MDDWHKQRRLLAAVGVEVKDIDMLDDLAARAGQPDAPAADSATRHRQVSAFVAASGGM
jgi:hypothetical protein